jgi:Secretion system C-terminal sorting domain
MKHVYYVVIVVFAFIAAAIPLPTSAQCLCTGGLPATAIDQSVTIAPTQTSVLTFSFQQFDPSIGTLSCVNLKDTISGISTTYVLNTDPMDTIAYLFQLTVDNKISGPGITINQLFNKVYGYDTLNPGGQPGDTITYGPDNIFNNATSSANTGGNPAYIGLGTVDFTYKINGGLIALDGGLNYKDSISTIIGGTLNLTYYWCPSSPLATTISNFSAFKQQNSTVLLEWVARNDQYNANYEIQYSKDGSEYSTVGNIASTPTTSVQVTAYQYQYPLAPADQGELYFRIKRTDANGNIVYSMIKEVDLQTTGSIGIQTFPNPVISSVTVQFNENQTGEFMFELVSLTGQVMQQNQVNMSATNVASLNLNSRPAKGVYLLRAQDLSKGKQYITKILLQ